MYTSKPEMSPIKLFHNVCAALQIKSIKQDLNDNSNRDFLLPSIWYCMEPRLRK